VWKTVHCTGQKSVAKERPTTTTAVPYLTLKADDRQELRIPALLKAHAAQIAAARGQSTSEYLVELIATNVTVDMAQSLTWDLAPQEVMTLLRVLSSPRADTAAMKAARAKAEELFGSEPSQ
jgi:hypothetical protein